MVFLIDVKLKSEAVFIYRWPKLLILFNNVYFYHRVRQVIIFQIALPFKDLTHLV